MNLSPHFSLAELTVTDHRSLDNTPNAGEIENLRRLAAFLELVKDRLGGLGCAADIRVPGFTPDSVVLAVMASGLAYDQVIREFDAWTHISIPNLPTLPPRKMALIIDKSGTRPFS